MPKIPDFSKLDLQSIVNSVKSIISPEGVTPRVAEGDPIGVKIVQISTLLQNTANSQAQAAKDLTKINNLLNELYKDLEAFRKLEAELRQKQQAEQVAPSGPATTGSPAYKSPSTGSQTEAELKTEQENKDKESL